MAPSIKVIPEEEIMDIAENKYAANNVLSRAQISDGEDSSGITRPLPMITTTDSLIIDRLIARIPLARQWVVAAIGLILLLIPLGLAYRDGIGPVDLLITYRSQFVYALVIVYMLVVFDALQRTRAGVAHALRPLIKVDDATYVSLVNRGCRVSPLGELSALGVGLAISLAINIFLEPIRSGPYAIGRYAYLSRFVVLSLDIWFIYVVFAMTRLTNTLLRQPIGVDVFDLAPFEPIGRQSLWLSLTFVGSMILGLLTFDTLNRSFLQVSLIYYGIVIVFTVAVFYVNTRNVHRVVAAKKRQRLESVGFHLARASAKLEELMTRNQNTYVVATEINALAIVKQELKLTRTWPYNTEMLRTLFISILTPLVVGLARVAAVLLGS